MATSSIVKESLYFRFRGVLATSEYIQREIKNPKEYLSIMWLVLIYAYDVSMQEAWCPRAIATLLVHSTHLCEQVIGDRGARMHFRWYVESLKSLIEEMLTNMSVGVSDNYVRKAESPYCLSETVDVFGSHMDTFANRRGKINQLGTQILGLLLDHKDEYENEIADAAQNAALWLTSSILIMYNSIDTDEKAGGVDDPRDSEYYPGYTEVCYTSAGCQAFRVFDSIPLLNLRLCLNMLRGMIERRVNNNFVNPEYESVCALVEGMLSEIKRHIPQYQPPHLRESEDAEARTQERLDSNAETSSHIPSPQPEASTPDLLQPRINNDEVTELNGSMSSLAIKDLETLR